MDSSNYHFNGYDYAEKRRKPPSLLAVLIMAVIGAFIGCLLYATIFKEAKETPELQQIPEKILQEYQNTEIVGAVEKASPAVVGISNSVNVNRQDGQMLIEQASGSGVIIDTQGHIVTNQHVISGAEKIEVVFFDGRTVDAQLVGEDALTDLAVVKINPVDDGGKYAALSDSDNVHIGETVIAIGNPLGLIFQQTVTAGVVSAVGRQVPIPQSQYRYTYIQTDAAINEGNSGGPLINLAGNIIGINSAKIKDTGVEGMGFAIPSNTVERVVEDIISHGKVRRPYIGVYIQDLAEATGNSTDRGVFVQEVSAGGAAAEAGVLAGDVIVAVDGRQINVTAQLFDQLLNYEPGEEITLKIQRNGSEKNLGIKLGEMPAQP